MDGLRSHFRILTHGHRPVISDPWTTCLVSAAWIPTVRSTAVGAQVTLPSAAASASRTTSACFIAGPARTASPNAKALHFSALTSPRTRLVRCSITSPRVTAPGRPAASSASTATPSLAWLAGPDSTLQRPTTSSWLFPPQTREVQFDEKWAFVAKKQKNCDPANPADAHKGDYWDHVAYDPEHRLVLAVIPGSRSIENAEAIVTEVKQRLGGAAPELITSDEAPAYASAIENAFGVPVVPAPNRPGRPRIAPQQRLPEGLNYATVHKHRQNNRVVAVERRQIFGTRAGLDRALEGSKVSRTVNTSFLERRHATDRGRNARKSRRTYRFSKDWRVHEAMTYFTLYSDNFCWPVRTLSVRSGDGRLLRRTPALAAGLTDHVWSRDEWLRFPALQSA